MRNRRCQRCRCRGACRGAVWYGTRSRIAHGAEAPASPHTRVTTLERKLRPPHTVYESCDPRPLERATPRPDIVGLFFLMFLVACSAGGLRHICGPACDGIRSAIAGTAEPHCGAGGPNCNDRGATVGAAGRAGVARSGGARHCFAFRLPTALALGEPPPRSPASSSVCRDLSIPAARRAFPALPVCCVRRTPRVATPACVAADGVRRSPGPASADFSFPPAPLSLRPPRHVGAHAADSDRSQVRSRTRPHGTPRQLTHTCSTPRARNLASLSASPCASRIRAARLCVPAVDPRAQPQSTRRVGEGARGEPTRRCRRRPPPHEASLVGAYLRSVPAVGTGRPRAADAAAALASPRVGKRCRPSAQSSRRAVCAWQAATQRRRHVTKQSGPGAKAIPPSPKPGTPLTTSRLRLSSPWAAAEVEAAIEQREAHTCTQPVLQSRGLGTVVVAQSRPPKPRAHAHEPSWHTPLPEHPIRHVRASHRAPAYPGSHWHTRLAGGHRPWPEHGGVPGASTPHVWLHEGPLKPTCMHAVRVPYT